MTKISNSEAQSLPQQIQTTAADAISSILSDKSYNCG